MRETKLKSTGALYSKLSQDICRKYIVTSKLFFYREKVS